MASMADHYRPSFREVETEKLMACARSGESALIVGISGVGKSNFFRHLLDPRVQQMYLQEQAADTLFVRVNFHDAPDLELRTIYSLILEQMEMLGEVAEGESLGKPLLTESQMAELAAHHEALLDAGNDLLRARRAFRLALRYVLRTAGSRLVLLFDQFDDILWRADPRLFVNLRGLREAYKYRLSFFVFLRSSMTAFSSEDDQREEFYELLSSNVHGLHPYSEEDARAMLGRLAVRHGQTSNEAIASVLIEVSGGHAGLLRALYAAYLNDRLSPVGLTANKALEIYSVRLQCDSIWGSLSVPEQQVLLEQVRAGGVPDQGRWAVQELVRKGVLLEDNTIFSPIFGLYVSQQEAAWNESVYLDEKTRLVWVNGEERGTLSLKEYALFKLLYDHADELVPKEKLLEKGWPELTAENREDQWLSTHISRIRKKLAFEENEIPNIEAVTGHGYCLRTGQVNS